MIENINKKSSAIVKMIALISIIFLSCKHIIIYEANVVDMIIFGIYMIVYIQLQGISINMLMKIKLSHISSRLIVGFFTGYAAVTAEYFISELINSNIILYAAGPILATVIIVSKLKDIAKERNILLCIPPAYAFIAVAIILYFSFLDSQLTYVRTNLADVTNVYQDYLYHMTLIDSIAKGYPIVDPNVAGEILNYHFFYDLLLAIPVRLFGITPQNIIWDCVPYLNACVLASSLYGVFRCIFNSAKKAGIFSILIMFSFVKFYHLGVNGAFKHLITNINAFSMGMSAFFCLIILISECTARNEIRINYNIILVFLAGLLMGIKAPIGLVMVAAVWGALIFKLLLKDANMNLFIIALAISIGSIIVYFACVGAENGSGAQISFYLIQDIKNDAFWNPLLDLLKNIGIPAFARKIIVLAFYFVNITGAVSIPFCISYIREFFLVVTRKQAISFPYLVICAMVPIAMVIFIFVKFPDYHSSEGYFCLLYDVLAFIIAMKLFEGMFGNRKLDKLIVAFTVICIIIGGVITINSVNEYNGEGVYNYHTENKFDTVSRDEYEGLCWLRNNTREDSLVATDRYMRVSPTIYDFKIMQHNTFFAYTAYSGRNFFFAATGYTFRVSRADNNLEYIARNNALYDPANTNRGIDARKLGVNYVIVSKRFNSGLQLEGCGYEECFKNKDMVIYHVKK